MQMISVINKSDCAADNIHQYISSQLLTIIITTSPTPSSPSPELVESVIGSLAPELSSLPLIISFDGFTISHNDRRAGGRLKRGQVPQAMADMYPAYIDNVKGLCQASCSSEIEDPRMHTYISSSQRTHTDGSTSPVTFVRHKFRQGFGFSVKAALTYCKTPLVLILQHDWVFTSLEVPIHSLVQILQEEEEVNYITFIARQSLCYERSRGESHHRYRAVFEAARALRKGRTQEHGLVSCLHFFDRPHLCKVSLYSEIFRQGIIRRGDFLEDTLGTAYLMSIANGKDDAASIAAWRKLGAWIYHPGKGDQVAIRHTSGRTSLTKSLQEERIRSYIRANQNREKDNADDENDED